MVRKKDSSLRKDTALKQAATLVSHYGNPVDISPPEKTMIIITNPDGSQQAITVSTGNLGPGEVDYLQKKLQEGSQLAVKGYESPVIQSKLVMSDNTVSWIDDIQSSDVSLADIIIRYKSLLTRIYNMSMIATSTDDTNMRATLKAIATMIGDDV